MAGGLAQIQISITEWPMNDIQLRDLMELLGSNPRAAQLLHEMKWGFRSFSPDQMSHLFAVAKQFPSEPNRNLGVGEAALNDPLLGEGRN